MKMKNLLAATALLPLFFSCKKEAATEKSSTALSYRLSASNPSSPLGRLATLERTDGSSVQWTSGTASANQIKFEAKNNSGEVEFKQNVQQQVDLFSAASVLGSLSILPGTYSEVEFKAFLAPSGNAHALTLNGSFTANGVTTPVSFQVATNVELKAEKSNVTVAAGSNYSVLNSLDLSQLTTGIGQADLMNATRTNGTIVISATSNPNIFKTMLANLGSHHGEAEVEHH